MFYSVRIPAWFIKLNHSLVWKIPTTEKILYLTFDDGPHETATPFVLDQLKQFNAKATFFCLGKNVASHPDIYKRILNEGHATGNHTYNHLNGWKEKKEKYIDDITDAAKYINSKLFRPPYGRVSPFVLKTLCKKLGYKIIMWHVLSGDFDEENTPEKCSENVINNAVPGSIIVFHDSQKAWNSLKLALPEVLKKFTEKGFSFKHL
ncbi:MAG TPA: polysaccharide deacetylase family protein [Parafilimonas sp.]|nr:polysaccharide deacetylase family protein [Parafilimonas sp.]